MVVEKFFSSVPRRKPEHEERQKEAAEIVSSRSLLPILEWSYGPKEWGNNDSRYWIEQEDNWVFQNSNSKEKEKWPEQTKLLYKNLKTILSWLSIKEVRGHFDPVQALPTKTVMVNGIEVPVEWDFKSDESVAYLARYFYNHGEPWKIFPLLSVDSKGRVIGTSTQRWKGKPPVDPNEARTSILEFVLTDPTLRRRGIATRNLATQIEYGFECGYKGKGAKEIRLWIMQDRLAGFYQPMQDLVQQKFGFSVVKEKKDKETGKIIRPYWPDVAKFYDVKTPRGFATLYGLEKKRYEDHKLKNNIRPYDIINLEEAA